MPVSFPEGFDGNAQDFIEKLLRKNPMDRLGYGEETIGYPSLKHHPFFSHIDFNSLHEAQPPIDPKTLRKSS